MPPSIFNLNLDLTENKAPFESSKVNTFYIPPKPISIAVKSKENVTKNQVDSNSMKIEFGEKEVISDRHYLPPKRLMQVHFNKPRFS